ncbi:MAG: 2-amino-4-hydroxy-6-hydroxymethyldihydropteridine diphosphokinase [Lachnospiraceae bacterium]|nr:2-amino-4-hydroxy-6-hydroxymethyldihydropteridine diphosphokinase [Lachnospiraceae bacterium]
MDNIVIKDLEIYAYHGVFEEEKKKGQPFIITAELRLDLRDAGMTDSLDKTVNYAEVCDLISQVMLEEKYNLIEAAAENIANTILIKYDKIKSVRIVIKKPEAPIEMSFDTVYVDITRSKNISYLSIGSNIGDKEGYLDYAVDQLNKDEYIRVNKISSYIETEPYGDVEQENFLNACLEIETLYSPMELLSVINDIEQSAGRKRLVHWGPRTLDIDILLYNKDIIMEDKLKIPHPDMTNRQFVLEPLCEIAPFAYHPGYNKRVIELYDKLRRNNNGS